MSDIEDDIPEEKPEAQPDLNFHTDIPVGEILRRTRVHYGQSLQQIESVLRIRASQLDALEQGDVSQLPGRVYAIGFVRSYSEYLGLDGDKMVHLFKEQSVGKQKKPDLTFSVPASESKVPNVSVIVVSIAGFLLLVGFVSFLMFPEAPKNEIPPVPESLTQSQLNQAPALVGEALPVDAVKTNGAQTAPASAAAAPVEQTPAMPSATNRVTLEIIDASWIEILDAKGAPLLRQVLRPGDIYLVPPDQGLVMTTGNAGGVKVKVDGKELPPLGDAGQIRRRLSLNPSDLLKAAPAAQPAPAKPVVPAANSTDSTPKPD